MSRRFLDEEDIEQNRFADRYLMSCFQFLPDKQNRYFHKLKLLSDLYLPSSVDLMIYNPLDKGFLPVYRDFLIKVYSDPKQLSFIQRYDVQYIDENNQIFTKFKLATITRLREATGNENELYPHMNLVPWGGLIEFVEDIYLEKNSIWEKVTNHRFNTLPELEDQSNEPEEWIKKTMLANMKLFTKSKRNKKRRNL